MINMRPYLVATAKGPVIPLRVFSNTVFHETLHRYVAECLDMLPARSTPLLEKYRSDPPGVLNHLHLFAIETMVYRKLGREKDLDVIIAFAQTLKSGALLKRAREIVAEEKPDSFVRELESLR
jgi:hypothetical protein